MRDILFRGQRTDNGEWVYGSMFSIDLETCSRVEKKKYTHCITEPKVEFYHGQVARLEFVIPETIGQYTGVTDKNGGKMIYEGDIVVARQGRNAVDKAVIRYENGAFMVYPHNGKIYERTIWEYWYNDWDLEVIGNIHDNPELLEDGEVN